MFSSSAVKEALEDFTLNMFGNNQEQSSAIRRVILFNTNTRWRAVQINVPYTEGAVPSIWRKDADNWIFFSCAPLKIVTSMVLDTEYVHARAVYQFRYEGVQSPNVRQHQNESGRAYTEIKIKLLEKQYLTTLVPRRSFYGDHRA